MEEGPVHSCPCFIYYTGLQVHKDGSWDMFSLACLLEEGGEGVISRSLVTGHPAIRSNAMLQAVELPAGISNLDSSLANMDRQTLPEKIIKLNATVL